VLVTSELTNKPNSLVHTESRFEVSLTKGQQFLPGLLPAR
jgi:hypothetical protein